MVGEPPSTGEQSRRPRQGGRWHRHARGRRQKGAGVSRGAVRGRQWPLGVSGRGESRAKSSPERASEWAQAGARGGVSLR